MKSLLPAIGAAILACCPARAGIVAIYEITNNSTSPTTFDGVTGTAFSASPTLDNAIPNANLISVSVVNAATTPLLAVTTGQYFQFTITPPAGKKLHFEAISFEASKEAPNSTGRGWVVRSSVDSFGADLGTQEIIGPAPTWTDFRTDLPPELYSNVTVPVTFRIYTYAANQLEFVDYDNIQIFAKVDEPPKVAVTTIVPAKNRVRIRGTATDDTAVASVSVNGQSATGTTTWRARVRLKPGMNRFRISATDDGGSTSDPVVIRLRRPRS
jgi:hypothetical protein